jgi:hypothetical protein
MSNASCFMDQCPSASVRLSKGWTIVGCHLTRTVTLQAAANLRATAAECFARKTGVPVHNRLERLSESRPQTVAPPPIVTSHNLQVYIVHSSLSLHFPTQWYLDTNHHVLALVSCRLFDFTLPSHPNRVYHGSGRLVCMASTYTHVRVFYSSSLTGARCHHGVSFQTVSCCHFESCYCTHERASNAVTAN